MLGLPALFSDNMVLQQQSDAPIWGWGNASSTIKLVGSWNPQDTVSAKVDNKGRWNTQIRTADAGGHYTLTIWTEGTPSDRIQLKNVLLGEVWLCSGQSNMEWTPNNGIERQQEEIAAANCPTIRYFSLKKRGSDHLQDDCSADWEVCTPDVMRRRSAVAYFFARNLQQQLGVPVGLIVSAWGGTPAETWIPKEVVASIDIKTDNDAIPWWPSAPGALYNSMIHPLLPYRIAGAIWYQGESNRWNCADYRMMMENLITSWRKGFQQDFPFYIVQIAPFAYGDYKDDSAIVREAQEQVTHRLPHTGLVVTNDIGDLHNIHPSRKQEVGSRLANLALGEHYGKAVGIFSSPTLESASIEKNRLLLSFSATEGGIVCKDSAIQGISITDASGNVITPRVRIKNNRLEIDVKNQKLPIRVQYCFGDTIVGNLYNSQGLPFAPFRMDVTADNQVVLYNK
ncbi:MAG: sialate O-acetylesterase [Muribaculaceae bacterium]